MLHQRRSWATRRFLEPGRQTRTTIGPISPLLHSANMSTESPDIKDKSSDDVQFSAVMQEQRDTNIASPSTFLDYSLTGFIFCSKLLTYTNDLSILFQPICSNSPLFRQGFLSRVQVDSPTSLKGRGSPLLNPQPRFFECRTPLKPLYISTPALLYNPASHFAKGKMERDENPLRLPYRRSLSTSSQGNVSS